MVKRYKCFCKTFLHIPEFAFLRYIQAGIRLCMRLSLELLRTLSQSEYIQVYCSIFKIY